MALADTFDRLVESERLERSPVIDHVAAVSAGIFGEDVYLDLDYQEDVAADVDANVVMTGSGKLVEVQGTAEGDPFGRAQLDQLLDLTADGIGRLVELQRESRQP